ncbi:MAG TPA: hypothetical protein VHO01_08260 [Jatrophihabitans sp.]|nr:hypothetical protein [Jatrophihabitans sp.]
MVEGPLWWPGLQPVQAEAAWGQLRAWVQQLVARFGLSGRVLPPCWFRHNGMVELLSALRDYENACYAASAAPGGGLDFLRGLREAEFLLGEWTGRAGCTAGEHHPDPARTLVTDKAGWDAHVAADVARRAQLLLEVEGVLGFS